MNEDWKIVKVLLDSGKVDKKALVPMFKIQEANRESLEKLIIQFKLVKREDVLSAKQEIMGGEPLMLNSESINLDIAKQVPLAMAKRYNLVCIDKTDDGKLKIAMHNPEDTFALDYIRMRTGVDARPYLALMVDLEEAWKYVYTEDKGAKRHPFFNKSPQQPSGTAVRQIPKKLTLPGFSEGEGSHIQRVMKKRDEIKEVTDQVRERAGEDKNINSMMDRIQKEMQALAVLSQSASSLNAVLTEKDVIIRILETTTVLCNAHSASILMYEDDRQYLYFKEVIGPESSALKKLKVPTDTKSIAGWVAINQKPLIVNDVSKDERHYKGIDEMLHFSTASVACVPLFWHGEVMGVMEAVNKVEGRFDDMDLEYMTILASQASISLYNASLMEQLQNFYLEVVEILIDCLESLDPVSRDHALNVARMTSSMARNLNFPDDAYEAVCYAAFLHDIGMIKCENEEEDELIKCHVTRGAQMLSHIRFFNAIVPFVKYHHERYDGKGLPEGLAGDDIPLGARVLAIAESYNERKAQNHDMDEKEFLDEFLSEFGTRFDPSLKDIFLKSIAE